MSRYREIYEELSATSNPSGKPYNTDDLLREAGIDAHPNDDRVAGIEAAIVYLAERVKRLEDEKEDLEYDLKEARE